MNRSDPDTANNSVDNSITSYNNDDDLNRKIIVAFEEVDNFIRENRQLFDCQPKEIKNILEKLSTNLDIIQSLAVSYEEMRQNNMNIHQYNTKVGEINQEEIKRLQVIYDEKKIKSIQSLEATQLQQQNDQLQIQYQDMVKENIDFRQIIKQINDMIVQTLGELNQQQTNNGFKIERFQEKTQNEQINYFKEIILFLIEKQNSPLLNSQTNQPDQKKQNTLDLQNERNIKIMNQLNSEIRNTLIMEKDEIQKFINKNSKMQQTQCSDEDFQSDMKQQQQQIVHNSGSFKNSMDTIQQISDDEEILSNVFEQIQIILRDVRQSTQSSNNILQTDENADVNIQQAKQHIVKEQKIFSQQCVNIKDYLHQINSHIQILISTKENSSNQLQKAIDDMNQFQFEIYKKIKHNCLNQEINENLNSNEIMDELDKLIQYPVQKQKIIKQNEIEISELAISIELYKRIIKDQQSEINLINIKNLGDDSKIIRLIGKLEQLDLEKALIIDDLDEIKKQFEKFKEDSNLKQQILTDENKNLILLSEQINNSNQIQFNKQLDKLKLQINQTESQQIYLDKDQMATNENQNIQQTSEEFLLNNKSSILDQDNKLLSLSNHNQNDFQQTIDEQQLNQLQQGQVQQKFTIMSSYIQNEDQKKMVWISDIDSLFENEHFKQKYMRLFESIKDFSQTLVAQWIDFLRIPLFSKSMVSMAIDDKDFLNNQFKQGIIEASNPKTLQELIHEVISIHNKLQDFNKKLLDQLSIHFQRKEISTQNLIKKFAMCKTELKIIKK